jgi:hypothetical protein
MLSHTSTPPLQLTEPTLKLAKDGMELTTMSDIQTELDSLSSTTLIGNNFQNSGILSSTRNETRKRSESEESHNSSATSTASGRSARHSDDEGASGASTKAKVNHRGCNGSIAHSTPEPTTSVTTSKPDHINKVQRLQREGIIPKIGEEPQVASVKVNPATNATATKLKIN